MIRAHWRGKVGVMVEPPAPLPLVEPPEWMADGICAQVGGHGWDLLSTDEQVKFCQPCPVIEACGAFGVDQLGVMNRAATTIYGGLTPDQIVDEARARKAVA